MPVSRKMLSLGKDYAVKKRMRVSVRRLVGLGLPLTNGDNAVSRAIWNLKHWGLCQFLGTKTPFLSQYGQDMVVAELLPQRNGTFLDIGAFDGMSFSNSFYLEKHLGWTGVCVEPNPVQFGRLQECRSCHCEQAAVVARATDEMEFTILAGEGAMLSGLCSVASGEKTSRIERMMAEGRTHMEKVRVSCRTVPEILGNASLTKVDFISLDIEGGELEIVKALDFDEMGTSVIAVEANNNSRELAVCLKKWKFDLITILGDDCIFYRSRVGQP